jgi:long-chain fatty acid transport protein
LRLDDEKPPAESPQLPTNRTQMNRTHHSLLPLIAVALAPALFGNAARLPSQDAWAVARGHAATASIDSSAAVWFNPAGLAHLTRDEIRLEPSVLAVDESFTSASGRTVKEQSDPFFTPSAFAAHRLTDRLVLGVGVLSPYGLSSDWPTNSGFGGLATFNEIKFVTSAASLAYQVQPGLAVGATVEYSSARANLNRLAAVAPGVVSSFGFKGRDDAFSGNVGVQWDIDSQSSIGVLYQLPTTMEFSGTATLQGVLSSPGKGSGWRFADNLAIGYRYKFTPDWDVEVGVDWTFWNRTRTVHLDAGPLSTNLVLNWQTSRYYSVGVEHRINEQWRVAAGYSYSENSVGDATFNPSLPDSGRHLLDGGVERSFGHWQVQLVTEVGLKSNRTISGPAPDGLGGSQAGTFHNSLVSFGASIAYRF